MLLLGFYYVGGGMIIPGYLQSLGYLEHSILRELSDRSFEEDVDVVRDIKPWSELRNVFDYVECMEWAVRNLDSLPINGPGMDLTPARYDSASLVFFAQATLDNMAVWLNDAYSIGLKGNEISFYKSKMRNKLVLIDEGFSKCLDEYSEFVGRLNGYRMLWLHRIAGGARC